MTVNELIADLQRLMKEGPHRGEFQVEDANKHTIGWIRRGSEKDDKNRIVVVLPEVDW